MPKKRISAHDAEVGRRIKIRRLELKMSQTKLAHALELTFQQVQKYEKGSNRISAGRLQTVAKTLGVPIDFFFPDVSKANESRLSELLVSAYSLRILKAMDRIENHRVRQRVVELEEEIADSNGG